MECKMLFPKCKCALAEKINRQRCDSSKLDIQMKKSFTVSAWLEQNMLMSCIMWPVLYYMWLSFTAIDCCFMCRRQNFFSSLFLPAPGVKAPVLGQVLHSSASLWDLSQQTGSDTRCRCVSIIMHTHSFFFKMLFIWWFVWHCHNLKEIIIFCPDILKTYIWSRKCIQL